MTWKVGAGTEGALVEDHRAPLVTLAIEFPAGTWSAWSREHAGATAFEMMGTDPERTLDKRADALAVDVTLSMGSRGARLDATCLKRDLEATVALVKDVLANTRYDPRELKRRKHERMVLRQAEKTDVEASLRKATVAAFYAKDDPRRRTVEDPEDVETSIPKLVATRDAIVRMPGRIVAFAGDITADDAERLAAGMLPPADTVAPAGVATVLRPIVEAAARPRIKDVHVRRLTQVYLALARDSVPWNDPRRPEALIADYVLGGHFYARLYVALRHEGGDTYGASTRDGGDVVPGLYTARTFTRTANAEAIEAKLRETLRVFRDRGITEAERADAAGALTGRRAFQRQSPDQILSRYLTEWRRGLAPGYLDELADRAAAVPLDQVNAFIRDWYDPAQFSMFRAVP